MMVYRQPMSVLVTTQEREAIEAACAKANISRNVFLQMLLHEWLAKNMEILDDKLRHIILDNEIKDIERRIAFPSTAIRNIISLIAIAVEPKQIMRLVDAFEAKSKTVYRSKQLATAFTAIKAELKKGQRYNDIRTQARQKSLMRATLMLDKAFKLGTLNHRR